MQFPDSTFAALGRPGDRSGEPLVAGRWLLLAVVLTVLAASAGILAGA